MREQQLCQLISQAEFYSEGWDEVLQMIEELSQAHTTTRPQTYLENLVPRLRDMQRRMNRIYYKPKGRLYEIQNYTYEMYCWYLDRGFPEEAVLPNKLLVLAEWLTPDERDQFRSRVEQ